MVCEFCCFFTVSIWLGLPTTLLCKLKFSYKLTSQNQRVCSLSFLPFPISLLSFIFHSCPPHHLTQSYCTTICDVDSFSLIHTHTFFKAGLVKPSQPSLFLYASLFCFFLFHGPITHSYKEENHQYYC